ncbi:hypothetical protein [Mesoterricola silvestris]|uniref:Outer membrane protein beta-barrel domain-containing protein n=1 Tax=Mesoterricola silvestris TaxID=2927979 RepID=A0AA48K7Y9_9BACT|nr:hypothetical protein [Mesoterricola silvestris]BDU71585.1 hypothetical protein METEAL_07590 [Mesoterricola silvestris]
MLSNHFVPRGLAVLACGAVLPLLAADPAPTFDFKVRTGLTAGDLRRDHDDNKAFGFAVAGRFPLGATSALNVELGFDVMPGQAHDVMPTSGSVYYRPEAPVTSYGGAPLYLSPSNSIDFRKERSQGFSLRGSYTDTLGSGSLYWFAGVSLDLHKVTAEMSGTLIPVYGEAPATAVPGYVPLDPADPASDVKDYYEGWAMAREKTKLAVGAHVGAGVALTRDFRLELTLRNIGTHHFDYRPFTYTGKAPFLEESTRRGFVFELALAFRI